jgi:hypothetical protein
METRLQRSADVRARVVLPLALWPLLPPHARRARQVELETGLKAMTDIARDRLRKLRGESRL